MVVVPYFEDKKIADTPPYYNNHWAKDKAAFTHLQQ